MVGAQTAIHDRLDIRENFIIDDYHTNPLRVLVDQRQNNDATMPNQLYQTKR